MSVQSEIDRIKKNVDDTLKAISDTGVQVGMGSDALPTAARMLANEKQDKLTGAEGQYVGFNSVGMAEAVSAPTPVYRTVTLPASGWSDSTQTVTVHGVLADETKQLIQPMPAIASQVAYMSAGIYCSGQAANSLTFTCSETPTENITLYIVITEVGS